MPPPILLKNEFYFLFDFSKLDIYKCPFSGSREVYETRKLANFTLEHNGLIFKIIFSVCYHNFFRIFFLVFYFATFSVKKKLQIIFQFFICASIKSPTICRFKIYFNSWKSRFFCNFYFQKKLQHHLRKYIYK